LGDESYSRGGALGGSCRPDRKGKKNTKEREKTKKIRLELEEEGGTVRQTLSQKREKTKWCR